MNPILRNSLLGTLVATASLLTACSAPVDASDGQEGAAALSQNEKVMSTLVQAFPSKDPRATGVDSWDVAVVTDGESKYVVARGFKGNGTRTEYVELLANSNVVYGAEQTHVLARAADPKVTLSLSTKTIEAMSADFKAMQPLVARTLAARCDADGALPIVLAGFGMLFNLGSAISCVGAYADPVLVPACAGFVALAGVSWTAYVKASHSAVCITK
jgi:hypothetical protein